MKIFYYSIDFFCKRSINQSRTIIYNYYYQEQTVITATEENVNDNLLCPYQGLYHFSPENAEYFFGREVFVENLFQYTETRNFIPILGASGSGKSSVILAGLVPKLVKIGHWQFTHFRPGNDPFHALAQALVPLYVKNLDETDRIAQARKLAGYFQDNTILLSDVFSTIQGNYPNNRILLIADQFEELYTLCNDEQTRRNFLDILLNTFKSFAEKSSLSTVLVGTMRADFLGNALSYRPLADVLQKGNIMLGPMNEKELKDIIEKPAQKLGVSFEGGLVERILRDVDKEPGNLPLLEFALTELWNKRKGKQLTHNAYQEIGEVSGALTCYADSEFSKLKPEQQQQVRRIFVQLVRPGAGTEDTRRVATKAELNDSNWNLVKQLADARLVVTSRTVITREITDNSQQQPQQLKEQETVEVVHEALIKNWGQLRQWMATDREFRTWQERLRAAMNYWQEKNQDQGLLLRGAALVQASEQLKTRRDELSQDELEFIQLSQELYEKEEKQKQKQRQQIVGGSIAFAVIVALLGVWSEVQRRKAFIGEENANFRTEIATLQPRLNSTLPVQMDVIKLNQKLKQAQAPTIDIQLQGTDLLRQIVDWPGQKPINSLDGHENSVIGVTFSPDGKFIASGSWDNTVKLWKLDGTLVTTLKGHENSVNSVAFSPDGKFIASGSWDNIVKLWKLDGTLVTTLKGHENVVNSVAFSPDGKFIASGSSDKTVKLWKLDGTLVTTLKGHENVVSSVAFSPDGKFIASGSWDKTVKLWKLDGTLVTTLKGHESDVLGVAFSPKGDVIASGSGYNTVKLWNFNRDELLKHACSSITGYLRNNPNPSDDERRLCGEKASGKVLFLQGEKLAAEGKIKQAVSKFQQAAKLDSNFSLKLAAASLVLFGELLAENGKLDEAILGFQKALEFDPGLKFNPKTEVAKHRFKRGQQLIEDIEYIEFDEEAILAYNQAQELDPNLKISASDWNQLCWAGSINKEADQVIFACNKAVELDPKNGWVYNSRGLARTLTGDSKGAIEDFEIFVKSAGNAEEKKQRKAWIASLNKGKNPFTDEVLEQLRSN
ncbi:putative WD repeat-containing protein all2124 [Planktothrix rubescens NIVA-CYA 18]|nr:putative WD repeat-containing protein all2124 [Planktothrix rubescens NIVA-CYA 18]